MKFFGKYDIVLGGKLYLRRYFIVRSKWFSVFLHNIILPDPEDYPHDHPWNFFGIVLWGGYTEDRYSTWGYKTVNFQRPFRPYFRRAKDIHHISDVEPNTWTLVFLGGREREWGFWDFQGHRFIDWKTHLKVEAGKEPDMD